MKSDPIKYDPSVRYVITKIDGAVEIFSDIIEETRDKKNTTLFLWTRWFKRRRMLKAIRLSDIRIYSVEKKVP